jgi:hypothetical protein
MSLLSKPSLKNRLDRGACIQEVPKDGLKRHMIKLQKPKVALVLMIKVMMKRSATF